MNEWLLLLLLTNLAFSIALTTFNYITIYYRGHLKTSHILQQLFSISLLWMWPLNSYDKILAILSEAFLWNMSHSFHFYYHCLRPGIHHVLLPKLLTKISQLASSSFSTSISILKLWFCNDILLFRKPWAPLPHAYRMNCRLQDVVV